MSRKDQENSNKEFPELSDKDQKTIELLQNTSAKSPGEDFKNDLKSTLRQMHQQKTKKGKEK